LALGAWPVLWSAEQGAFMRWIRCTYRGFLGNGVEQFQFKMDYGMPGDDPTLDEADAPAWAEARAAELIASLAYDSGTGTLASFLSSAHGFSEIGAVQMTQTEATSVDGTGGNQEQSYPGGWYMFPTGSEPRGSVVVDSLPYEVACAVTLHTDTRGPRGRGRLYLPPFNKNALAAGGLFSTVASGTAGEFVKQLANRAATATSLVPVVVSGRAIQLHEIVGVSTGLVPDSQRRRRRSQNEAPIALAL
jgi:hypothetical protein